MANKQYAKWQLESSLNHVQKTCKGLVSQMRVFRKHLNDDEYWKTIEYFERLVRITGLSLDSFKKPDIEIEDFKFDDDVK